MTRILVCGGRDFDDRAFLFQTLSDLAAEFAAQGESVTIIHGAALGADSLAGVWANINGAACVEYPANWTRDGRAAGPIRNAHMLASGRPDVVVAFPGGRGTADMVSRAEREGVPVRDFRRHSGLPGI